MAREFEIRTFTDERAYHNTAILIYLKAVKSIGSTPTAILGALEPVTAVSIGVLVFGEILTSRLIAGIILILGSVVLIAVKKK